MFVPGWTADKSKPAHQVLCTTMFRILPSPVSVMSKIATILAMAFIIVFLNTISIIIYIGATIFDRIYKIGIGRCHVIRLVGFTLILSYIGIGVVNSGSTYRRVMSEIDQSTIMKTTNGLSEIQCVLNCRKSTSCKNSFYEIGNNVKTSHCHFLNDNASSNMKIVNGKSGMFFERIPEIGNMLYKSWF